MADHLELASQCLFREALVAAVPKGLAKRFRQLSLEKMCAELPLVRFTGRSHMGRAVEYYLSQRKLAPHRNLEFDVSEAVLRMVASRLGFDHCDASVLASVAPANTRHRCAAIAAAAVLSPRLCDIRTE